MRADHRPQTRRNRALRSEARFRALADTTPAFIWSTDPSGRLLYANRYYLEFTGLSTIEMAAARSLEFLHPSDRERFLREFAAAVVRQAPSSKPGSLPA